MSDEKAKTPEESTQPPAAPHGNIYQRLLRVMEMLEAPAKGYGKAVSYPFHTIDATSGALRPCFVACGVWPRISPVSMVREEKVQSTAGGEKDVHVSTILLEVTFINVDDPTDVDGPHQIEGQGWDYSDKSDGKAWSYALKPFLLATFNMRGAPDNEDDDIQGARSRGSGQSRGNGGKREYPSARAAREVKELAETGDATKVWAAVAKAIKPKDEGGLDDDSGFLAPGKVKALFGAALSKGWGKDAVQARLQSVADITTAQIPWKAGDAVLAAFSSLPAPVLAGTGATAAAKTKREPTWDDWKIVSARIGTVDSSAPCCPEEKLTAYLGKESGWAPGPITRVLKRELGLTLGEIPEAKQIPDLIARILTHFMPQDIMERYDAEAKASAATPAPDSKTTILSKVLDTLKPPEFPGSDEAAAWERWLKAREDLADAGLAMMDELPLVFDDAARNGGRTVEGVNETLADAGIEAGSIPSALQKSLLALLSSFPEVTEPKENADA